MREAAPPIDVPAAAPYPDTRLSSRCRLWGGGKKRLATAAISASPNPYHGQGAENNRRCGFVGRPARVLPCTWAASEFCILLPPPLERKGRVAAPDLPATCIGWLNRDVLPLDRNLSGLGFFRFWQRNVQDAVFVFCGDFVFFHRTRD